MTVRRELLLQLAAWASAVSLVVIAAGVLARSGLAADLPVLVGTAVAGGAVAQGLSVWVVRQQRQAARERAIADLRAVLRDRINNKLAVAVGVADLGPDPEVARAVAEVADEISTLLATLSDDTVREWQARYGYAAAGA